MKRKAAVVAAPAPRPRFERTDGIILLVALVLCLLAFANALRGEFVYDDGIQIAQNQFIQDGRYFGQALTSDVWAFKGDRGEAWSNYWRPLFVLWLMLNFRLFGMATLGWHLANVLLHAGVVALAYGLLRYLGLGRWSAAAIVFLFAIHPSHVESVAWISGSPDLLLALFFLGSLWLALAAQREPRPWMLPVAWLLALCAMLSKETGIVLPVVVGLALYIFGDAQRARKQQTRWMEALRGALPFALIAVGYFVARWAVLRELTKEVPWERGPVELLLTTPSLILFYVRQALFPLWIGPSYPLRVVLPSTISIFNFWLPLLIVGILGYFTVQAIRQGRIQQLGLVIFLLPLLPAFNLNAFLPEQIVHDRYLYLPLLGLLMMLVPTLADALNLGENWNRSASGRAALGAGLLYALLLTAQTVRYNTAWTSELNLWSWAIRSDPGSSFNWSKYGIFLYDAERLPEAKVALDRALGIASVTDALLARADISAQENRLEDAQADLELVLSQQPQNTLAYERLALVYQRAGRLEEAAALLTHARTAVPYWHCGFTSNLAVVYYLQGDKARALAELETVPAFVEQEYSPSCRIGLYHLGELYREMGRESEGRATLQQFLAVTSTFYDERTQQFRTSAQEILAGGS